LPGELHEGRFPFPVFGQCQLAAFSLKEKPGCLAEYLKPKTKKRKKEAQMAVDIDSLLRYINKLRESAAWARPIFIRSIKSS
jgi:hypothetical protein